MKRSLRDKASFVETIEQVAGVRVGRTVGVGPDGSVLVDFPGNTEGPVAARLTSSLGVKKLKRAAASGQDVLLVFENEDPGLPIIVDTIYSLVDEISAPIPSVIELEKPDEVVVDGERVVFDAKKEIVLRCGRASITLTRVGKVLIRGEYVSNHASGVNRIKGGSVQIN